MTIADLKTSISLATTGRKALAEALGLPDEVVNAPSYEIVAADEDDVAVVRIYEGISKWFGVNAAEFVRDLADITASTIRVEMNSPGGLVFDGIAIYNALRIHDAHIITRADSLVASIASVIFQAGDDRQMVTGSEMMIHKAWGGFVGNSDECLAYAELLARQDDKIAAIYASKGDRDDAEYLDLMAAESWLTPAEAVDLGLADEVVDPDDIDDDEENEDDDTEDTEASTVADPKNSPNPNVDLGASWVREYLSAETSA